MSKKARVLETLLARGDRGLHRFQALELCRDHVLPSTVSALRKLGVEIHAEPVDAPGFGGHMTRLARYYVPASERERAQQILTELTQRKAPAARTTSASATTGGQADDAQRQFYLH